MGRQRTRVMVYGPSVGEHSRDQLFGPAGNKLKVGDVAVSGDILTRLFGWRPGQPVPVGRQIVVNGQTYTVGDISYTSPGNPNTNTVEIWNGNPRTTGDWGTVGGTSDHINPLPVNNAPLSGPTGSGLRSGAGGNSASTRAGLNRGSVLGGIAGNPPAPHGYPYESGPDIPDADASMYDPHPAGWNNSPDIFRYRDTIRDWTDTPDDPFPGLEDPALADAPTEEDYNHPPAENNSFFDFEDNEPTPSPQNNSSPGINHSGYMQHWTTGDLNNTIPPQVFNASLSSMRFGEGYHRVGPGHVLLGNEAHSDGSFNYAPEVDPATGAFSSADGGGEILNPDALSEFIPEGTSPDAAPSPSPVGPSAPRARTAGVLFGQGAQSGARYYSNNGGRSWMPIGQAPAEIRWAANSGTGNFTASQTARGFEGWNPADSITNNPGDRDRENGAIFYSPNHTMRGQLDADGGMTHVNTSIIPGNLSNLPVPQPGT